MSGSQGWQAFGQPLPGGTNCCTLRQFNAGQSSQGPDSGASLPPQCCSSASSSVRQLFQAVTPVPPQEAMMQASRWPWVLWSQAVSRSASVFGGSQTITGYPGPGQSWEKFLGSSRTWGLWVEIWVTQRAGALLRSGQADLEFSLSDK